MKNMFEEMERDKFISSKSKPVRILIFREERKGSLFAKGFSQREKKGTSSQNIQARDEFQ